MKIGKLENETLRLRSGTGADRKAVLESFGFLTFFSVSFIKIRKITIRS